MPTTFVFTAGRQLGGFSAAIVLSSLVACGGGGPETMATPVAPVPAPAAASTTVSGAVVKGPVSGAQVCAYAVAGNARGAALGSCTTTVAGGAYSVVVPAGSGALWIEATGGTYVDEITSATVGMPAGSPMASLVTANGAAVTTMLTPLTTLALNAARNTVGAGGTLDAGAHAEAAAQVLAALGLPNTLNITATLPAFGAAGNAYGAALTVISQMVANGLTLANILATTQPGTLAAAYAAAAAPAPVAAAPLVISAATPSSWNGTLGVAQAQFEHGSSSGAGGPYDAGQPYCRVAAYGLLDSGDNTRYFLEIPFRKDTRAIGLLVFGLDASGATLARELGPLAGVAIDTANRRITFTNVVIGSTATNKLTLNGTLNYPTNVDASNRAACG